MFKRESITLYREVNKRIRYYKLTILPNLFGEYILEKEYGSIKAKRATRVLCEYFLSYKEAYKKLEQTLHKKYKRGYTKKREGYLCNT